MFSQRARAYLGTLERRDHIGDLTVVRHALRCHGVPERDVFLEFHAALAGYVEPAGRDEFVYGIIHKRSYWFGSLAPNADQDKGVWFISYADAHPSYERQMDEHGVMYQEGGARRAASFRTLVEQHAFIMEFWNSGTVARRLLRVPVEDSPGLRSQLESHRLADVSDEVASIWTGSGWCLLGYDEASWELWSFEDAHLGEIAQFVR